MAGATPAGGLRRVSACSVFEDDVWAFATANRWSQRRIFWKNKFANGLSLGDPGNEALLITCKTLIYNLLLGWDQRKAVKPSTAATYAHSLLAIVSWMLEQGMSRFADLDQHEISRLREALSEKTFEYSVGAREWKRRETPRSYRASDVYHKLTPLRYLVLARDFIADVPTWSPDHDLAERGGTVRPNKGGEWEPIPFHLAIKLFGESLRWIEEYGPLLVAAKTAANAAYAAAKLRVPKTRAIWQSDALRAIRSSGGVIVLGSRLIDLRHVNKGTFKELVRHLETACFVVVAGFTGMRIHELSNLCVDCLSTRSISGRNVLCLTSREGKTAVGGSTEPAEWIAGFDVPGNSVRKAVEVMRDIAAEERRAAGVDALFLSWADALTVARVAAPISVQSMNNRLNRFLQAVSPAEPWRLTTHQFRKTFARFVARNHRLALLALRRHFKHVSLAMTEHYAGHDFDLVAAVAEERHQEMREALHDLLGSEYLGGKLGVEIVSRNESFRGSAGEHARDQWIEAFLKSDSPIMSHPYGLCFVFRETARCGMDTDRVGLGTCIGCSNLVVGPRHESWWVERLRELDRFEAQMIGAGMWGADRAASLEEDRGIATRMLSIIRSVARDDSSGAA